MVVVLHPVGDPFLSVLERIEPRPLQELLPDRLPEPLDLPQRHRVMRRAADVVDPVLGQFHLEAGFPFPGRILLPVVRQHLLRDPMIADRPPIDFHHVLRRLGSAHPEPRDVAGVIVDEPDQVAGLPVHPKGEDVALPHLVGRGPLEKPRLRGIPPDFPPHRHRHRLVPVQRLPHSLRAARKKQRPSQPLGDLAHPEGGMLLLNVHDRLMHRRR